MRFGNSKWNSYLLGEICTKFDYGLGAEAVQYDGVNKYIRITDIDEKTSKYKTENICSPSFTNNDCIVENNDILFARTGASTGKTYLYNVYDGLMFFAGFLIRAHVKPEFNSVFIFEQTKTYRYKKWVSITSSRSGQPGINSSEFKSFNVFVPDKNSQDKIANFLTLIDKRIETQSKIIEEYKCIEKYIIEKLINKSDKEIKFKDVYKEASGGGTPDTSNNSYYQGHIPFIKIDDLNEKYLISHKSTISELGLKNSSAWLIPPNSIIYSNGATIGKISINTCSVATKQGILGIIPKDNISVEYLYYLMKTTYFRKQIKRITVKGTMECAYLKDIDNIKCFIPDINKQKNVVNVLKIIDEKIDRESILLEKLKEQKKYLLSNMFI